MNQLLIGAFAMIIAFGAGYYTKSEFNQADQAEQSQKAIRETAASIVESVETSQKVEEKVDQDVAQITRIERAIAKRPITRPTQENPNGHATDSKPDPPGRDMLDVCTVRLLNAAREGRPLESAGCSDAEIRTTTQAER